MDDIPREILECLEKLYPKLAEKILEAPIPSLDLPPLDQLSALVAETSFKIFEDSEGYCESVRAKSYPTWSRSSDESTVFAEIYRVFYNNYSYKIYVDLDGPRWSEIRGALKEEPLYCDILRTLILVHDCEVRRVKDTVSIGADEITLPIVVVPKAR